jgi:hypothetical protein
VRPPDVVPQQPIYQLHIEGGHIVSQKRSVLSNEVLPDRPIESLDEGIHPGRARIGVEMGETERGARLFEILGEFAPVVRLKLVNTEWTNPNDSAEEVGG